MPGNDSYTKLLVHCDGDNESVTIPDFSGSAHGNATVEGNAQLDTTQKKFGTASLLLDGDQDWIYWAHSDDWDVKTNWTLDFQALVGADPGVSMCVLTHYESSNDSWHINYNTSVPYFNFQIISGGVAIVNVNTDNIDIMDSAFHHVALCKVGNVYGTYVDGVQLAYVDDDNIDTFTGVLRVGILDGVNWDWKGHLDEVRIQQNNYFGATPNAGKTDTITPPTKAYSTYINEINIGDAWKDVTEMKINIGDVWKDVTEMKINIGDVWKDIF